VRKHRIYYGLKWDDYTPAVEGQILRDCMALQAVAQGRIDELVIVCDSDKADGVLKALGLRRLNLPQKARSWVLYKTKEEYPEEPEWCRTVIHRDLWQPRKPDNLTVLDDEHTNGYYLPPQGRLAPDTISLLRPAPNGYIPTDPALVMIWSNAKDE
jgi:hypothetical protein